MIKGFKKEDERRNKGKNHAFDLMIRRQCRFFTGRDDLYQVCPLFVESKENHE